MQTYRTLKAIAERLGLRAPHSVAVLIARDGLPAYRMRQRKGWVWHIDEQLIQAWQLKRANAAREQLMVSGTYPLTGEERKMNREQRAAKRAKDRVAATMWQQDELENVRHAVVDSCLAKPASERAVAGETRESSTSAPRPAAQGSSDK